MKKYLKVIILVAIMILLAVVGIIFYLNSKYTIEEAISLINPQISNNMYLKEESVYEDSEEKGYTTENYIKDNKLYICRKYISNEETIEEYLFDFENKKQYNIFHYSREIYSYKLENASTQSIILSSLDFYKNLIEEGKDSYEYYGKYNIDGKEYLKISVNIEENRFLDINEKLKMYFFIDEQEKHISKIEYYTIGEGESKLVNSVLFTYSYNTVVDDNILKFDINNYSDYNYVED